MPVEPTILAGWLVVISILGTNLWKLREWNKRREQAEQTVKEALTKAATTETEKRDEAEKLRRTEFKALTEQVGGVNDRLDRQDETIKAMQHAFEGHVVEDAKQLAWLKGRLGEPVDQP